MLYRSHIQWCTRGETVVVGVVGGNTCGVLLTTAVYFLPPHFSPDASHFSPLLTTTTLLTLLTTTTLLATSHHHHTSHPSHPPTPPNTPLHHHRTSRHPETRSRKSKPATGTTEGRDISSREGVTDGPAGGVTDAEGPDAEGITEVAAADGITKDAETFTALTVLARLSVDGWMS